MNNQIRYDDLVIPRVLFEMELPQTAILLYGILLSRYTLSVSMNRNDPRFRDEDGEQFIVYPIDSLAEAVHKNRVTVIRNLDELEHHRLIRRVQHGFRQANRIYVYRPQDCGENTANMCINDANNSGIYAANTYGNATSYVSPVQSDTLQECNPKPYKKPYNKPYQNYGNRNDTRRQSGMFAPIPDYENCESYGL